MDTQKKNLMKSLKMKPNEYYDHTGNKFDFRSNVRYLINKDDVNCRNTNEMKI